MVAKKAGKKLGAALTAAPTTGEENGLGAECRSD